MILLVALIVSPAIFIYYYKGKNSALNYGNLNVLLTWIYVYEKYYKPYPDIE